MESLCYELKGNAAGEPLLLLHGFLGNRAEWQALLPVLGQYYHCLLVDLPGHGGSADIRLADTDGFAQTNKLLLNLVEGCFGTRRVALYGYSLGGRIALQLALATPLRWRWLVLESANPGLPAPHRAERLANDQVWARRLLEEGMASFLEAWYRQPVFASLPAPRRQQMIAARLANDPEGLATMLNATSLGRQPDCWDALQKLPLPWLYLAGAKDQKFVQIAAQLAAACKPPSGSSPCHQSFILPGAGHNIHYQKPEPLLDAVLAFVRQAGFTKELT